MKFGVVIPLADEGPDQLDYCLRHLRAAHPRVPVRVVSDGVPHPSYADLCKRHGASYTLGRYLKRNECGGAWWRRTLEEGLKTGQPWFLKVDPDTRFWRPVRSAPRHAVAGSLIRPGEMAEHLQGGAQAFRRDAAEKLLHSPWLDDPALSRPAAFCPDRDYLKSWQPSGYMSSDFQLMWLLRSAYIAYGDWPEVACRWEVAPPNFELQHAITHPHKLPAAERRRGVSAGTPLRVITTCMGRKDHLQRALPRWLNEPGVEVTVVDWSCPQGTADWVRKHQPRCRVVSVPGRSRFNLAAARNAGARVTPENGLWAFLDADLLVKPGWAAGVRAEFVAGHYHLAAPLHASMTGSVILEARHWREAGGYDETVRGWGCDDLLFYLGLRQIGVRPATWPGSLAETIPHTNAARTAFYDEKDKWESNRVGAAYYAAKAKVMVDENRLPDKDECNRLYASAAEFCRGHALPVPGGYPRFEKPTIANAIPVKPTRPISPAISAPPKGTSMQTISVINCATIDLGIPFERLVELGNAYLAKVVDPLWPGSLATLVAARKILPNTRALVIVDDAEQSAAIGYRSITPDGRPLAKVFARTALAAGTSITEVFTRELAALQVDPDRNLTAADAAGRFFAVEVADPVEADSFPLDGYPVGNIVSRAWFEPTRESSGAKYDYLGLLKHPFELRPNGRASVLDRANGTWTEIHGSADRQRAAKAEFGDRKAERRERQRRAQTCLHAEYAARK